MMVLRLHYFVLARKSITHRYFYLCLGRRAINGLKFHSNLTVKMDTANGLNSVEEYLTSIGANVTKIHREIKFPKLELLEKVKPVVDLLQEQCYLKPIDVGRMVTKRPRILLLDKEHIERCIQVLRNTGLKEEDITLMLKKSPGILTSKIEETLDGKIEVLYNLNVLPPFSMKDVLKIIKKCPALVSTCTPSSIQDKLHFLQNELGFYRRQLRNMIIKQPSILTFSQENIMAKFDYCYREIGVSVPDIARCPRVWQCSLKRLRERHLFLRHVRLINNHTHIDDFGLGKIVTPTNTFFAEHVAGASLVEFQEFAKTVRNK